MEAALRAAFAAADGDGNGVIDSTEFRDLCKSILPPGTPDTAVAALLAQLDSDHDGSLALDELMAQHAAAPAPPFPTPQSTAVQPSSKEAKLRKAFAAADSDGNGAIDSREFRALCADVLPPNTTDSDLEALLAQLDQNHNGSLDLGELLGGFSNAAAVAPPCLHATCVLL